MKNFFLQSVGQKFLIGLSGMGLILFVLVHMAGNLFIFAGPKAYNLYAHQLSQSWVLVFEIGLAVLFISHIVLAIIVNIKNFFCRKTVYAQRASDEKATALYQRTLLAQGAVILVFVILHLITFKFGPHYEITYDGKTVRDIFQLVVEVFQNPITVIGYLLALGVLFFHLLHGLESATRSLGLWHPHWHRWIKAGNWLYAAFVILGYISQPVYVFFFY